MTGAARPKGTPLPDGYGLAEETRVLVAEHGLPVHLRLTYPGGRCPIPACGQGLGELWTGKPSEVTCPTCLETVHA